MVTVGTPEVQETTQAPLGKCGANCSTMASSSSEVGKQKTNTWLDFSSSNFSACTEPNSLECWAAFIWVRFQTVHLEWALAMCPAMW